MEIDFGSIRAQFPLVETASRYIEVIKIGGKYKALCPFHDDTKPSLNFYQGSDGFDRYRCFACNAGIEGGDVIDFVAAIERVSTIEACKILTGDNMPQVGQFKKEEKPSQANLWTPIVPVPDDAPDYNPAITFNPTRGEYVRYMPTRQDPYINEFGELLCWVVRLEFDSGDKICPTICYCSGPEGKYAWCAKRMKPPHPLLGLDQLAARPDDIVLVVSGEKCYDDATKEPGLKALVVCSWLGGDGNIENVDVSPLVDRWLYLWPDADESGIESMLKLINLIERHGTG